MCLTVNTLQATRKFEIRGLNSPASVKGSVVGANAPSSDAPQSSNADH